MLTHPLTLGGAHPLRTEVPLYTDLLRKPILIRALEGAGVQDTIVFTHAGIESWLVPSRA
jgi:hypothetical protein